METVSKVKNKTAARKTMASKKKKYDKELLVSMFKEMALYRRFEERVLNAYTKQKFSGFCHVHIGQEGLCVGVQRALRDTDYMISGYRSHTQAIAKGITPNEVFAELLAKKTGCCGGKGGSMHMLSAENRFYGGHGIVGGQAPIALGVGFKIKYQQEDDIMVCYLGDAAMNQGQVFEALNMAAAWDIPVLYVIENNRYGMGTDITRTTSLGKDGLYKRALGFDMACSQVNGQDVLATYEHVSSIVDQMRKDKKPYLLEALTYRYKGHSVSDPGLYRSKDEVKDYMENNDPIKNLSAVLLKEKFATEDDLKAWDKEAKELAKAAEKFAEESPEPDVSERLTDVLAD